MKTLDNHIGESTPGTLLGKQMVDRIGKHEYNW